MGAKGELSYQQRLPEFNIDAAKGLVASPDGAHLYAGGAAGVAVFARDPAGGDYQYLETATGSLSTDFRTGRGLAISPDGGTVYLAAGQPDNAVLAFDRDPGTGQLSFLETEEDGVDDPSDPGGTVEDLFRPDTVAVSPDGESVYAVSEARDAVIAFERDLATGEISFLESEVNLEDDPGDPGSAVSDLGGPVDVVVSPDGNGVYAVAKDSDAIAIFERDEANGEPTFVEAAAGVEGPPGSGPRDVIVSRDGKSVYAAAFGETLHRFQRESATGSLALVETEEDDVDDPGDPGGAVEGMGEIKKLELSRDGGELYVGAAARVGAARGRTAPGRCFCRRPRRGSGRRS